MIVVDEVAEWLRRWTANPLCSARVGSNPILVVFFFFFDFYVKLMPSSLTKLYIFNKLRYNYSRQCLHNSDIIDVRYCATVSSPVILMHTYMTDINRNTAFHGLSLIILCIAQLSVFERP